VPGRYKEPTIVFELPVLTSIIIVSNIRSMKIDLECSNENLKSDFTYIPTPPP
jgi:hypothetical protein